MGSRNRYGSGGCVECAQLLGLHAVVVQPVSGYGVRVGWADEVIEALPATAEEASLLTIPRKSSILSITRVIITTDETPVEMACSRYRGDRYRASVRVPATNIE